MNFTRLQTLCVLLSVAACAPVAAQTPVASLDSTSTDYAALLNATPRLWFVQLASPPKVEGTPAAQIAREHATFRSAAASAGLNYTERYAYQTLFNGFSVKVGTADIGKLTRIPGVQNIYPVSTVELNAVQSGTSGTPDQQDWLKMTGADYAQNQLGLHGEGVRLAIIDTGIDYTHPDLGGCFGAGCRVEMGYDFVGDNYNGGNDPVPDPDPMDCFGHGTHVAGIAGADGHGIAGHVTGVAPHVKFHAYRIMGCSGGATTDVVVAAMEKAYLDGTDILSMSLGSADDWAESPLGTAGDRLVRKGVVVVASAGNNGATAYSVSSPSTGRKVISVASFESVSAVQKSFTISPDAKAIGYIAAVAAPTPPTSGSLPLRAAPDTNGCTAPAAGTYTGMAALIKRGTCTFPLKARNAQDAGASAVVLYNNVAGFLATTVAGSPPITIPVVAVTVDDGTTMASRLAGGPVAMTWADWANVANPFAGLVSTFSAFGPTAELDLKPDLGAPGGYIFSTWPVSQGSYATISGTSMAAPHVAGSVALLLQARPRTPPPLVRDLLQNTAVPANWNRNPSLGFLDSVEVQGAGLIHVDNAIRDAVSVSPAKLALGDSAAGPATRTLTFSNSGGSTVTYGLSHVAALTTGETILDIVGSQTWAPASASFSVPSVTVPAGGSASVQVTITAPTAPSRSTYGGYLVATPEGGGQVLRVPYVGAVDYQAVNLLPTTAFLKLAQGQITLVTTDGAVFNLTSGDLPVVLFLLDHPARTLSAEVFAAPAAAGGPLGKDWHRILKIDYLPHGIFGFVVDGTTTNGNLLYTLPPGSYVIVMTALDPLGDPSNPSSVETWQSPVFIITR